LVGVLVCPRTVGLEVFVVGGVGALDVNVFVGECEVGADEPFPRTHFPFRLLIVTHLHPGARTLSFLHFGDFPCAYLTPQQPALVGKSGHRFCGVGALLGACEGERVGDLVGFFEG